MRSLAQDTRSGVKRPSQSQVNEWEQRVKAARVRILCPASSGNEQENQQPDAPTLLLTSSLLTTPPPSQHTSPSRSHAIITATASLPSMNTTCGQLCSSVRTLLSCETCGVLYDLRCVRLNAAEPLHHRLVHALDCAHTLHMICVAVLIQAALQHLYLALCLRLPPHIGVDARLHLVFKVLVLLLFAVKLTLELGDRCISVLPSPPCRQALWAAAPLPTPFAPREKKHSARLGLHHRVSCTRQQIFSSFPTKHKNIDPWARSCRGTQWASSCS